jgi:hypothetical protein
MVYDESRQSGFVDKNIAEFHFVLKKITLLFVFNVHSNVRKYLVSSTEHLLILRIITFQIIPSPQYLSWTDLAIHWNCPVSPSRNSRSARLMPFLFPYGIVPEVHPPNAGTVFFKGKEHNLERF